MKILFWLTVILVLHAYCVYPILLYIFRRVGIKSFSKTDRLPRVSVIVSAYNEERVIESRIKNLLNIDYPKDRLEIIIASDGSFDSTNKIVKKYEDRGVRLLDYKARRGKAEVLNRSAPLVKNGIIVFSDANTFFTREALKKLVRNFGDKRVGCVCGEMRFRARRRNETGQMEGFYWRYEVFMKRLEGMRGSLLGANGGIYGIRRKLFKPVPGDTIVEDFVIPMKILEMGYRVVYEPEAIAYEDTAKTIVQEMARRIRIGAGDFQSLVLTRRLLNPLYGFSSFAFWSHKVIRWFAPFLLTGALIFNAFLVGEKFYLLLFLAQISFYFAALLGRLLSTTRIHMKLLGFCYYFVSMNIALLVGFFKFMAESQSVMWERTER